MYSNKLRDGTFSGETLGADVLNKTPTNTGLLCYRVCSHVSCDVTLGSETLAARVTLEVPLPRVCHFVDVKAVFPCELFPTHHALVMLPRMDQRVSVKRILMHEFLAAVLTFEVFNPLVDKHMRMYATLVLKHLPTHCTVVGLLSVVCRHV